MKIPPSPYSAQVCAHFQKARVLVSGLAAEVNVVVPAPFHGGGLVGGSHPCQSARAPDP